MTKHPAFFQRLYYTGVITQNICTVPNVTGYENHLLKIRVDPQVSVVYKQDVSLSRT